MAKLNFVISAENTPRISDEEFERLRKLVREEVDDEGALMPRGRAVFLAQQGFHVLRCREDKTPLTPNGCNGATTDLEIIRASSWTRALIGVHTGKSGLVVLDIDRKDGKDGFATLQKLFPEEVLESWTSTFWYRTPSGGAHFVFSDPDGKIGRIIGAFKALNGGPSGVDILGGDGYFIFHPDDVPPNLIDLCDPFPDKIIEALEHERRSANDNPAPQTADLAADHPPTQGPADEYRLSQAAHAALAGRAADLANVLPGERNEALFKAVCYVGKWIAHGYLTAEQVKEAFRNACQANGYFTRNSEASFEKSFASGIKASANDPYPYPKERLMPGEDGQREGQRETGPAHGNGAHGPNGEEPGSSAGPEAKAKVEDLSLAWGDPQPIDAPLHPVDGFDAEALLPESIRDYVVNAAWRMPCAVDYVAASLIVAAAAVIGARCGIKPKRCDDWIVVPNLWGGIVGDPSQKKTPAISEGMKPFGRLAARAMTEHEKAQEDRSIVKLIRDAQKENIEGKLKNAAKGKGDLNDITKELKEFLRTAEPEPILRRYKTNDATVEKLGEMLRDNPNGLLVSRDELVGLLSSWDKTGHENDRQFFLESWNGTDSFDTDRIGRGSIFIPNLCVSVFGGIQPDKLTGYLEQASNALANDGMLQRFQVLVYPDPVKWEYRDAIPNRAARERVNEVFENLDDFDPVEWDAAPANQFVKFPHFRFDNEAQETYIEFSKELHRGIEREDNPLIRQHLAKYDKLFPALALVLHLMECAASDQRGPVTAAAVTKAAAWCRYLESHARRCYGLIADEGLRAAQALAKHLASGNLPKGFNLESFSARDVRRNQWRYLTTNEAIGAALDWLEDEGWLRRKPAAKKAGKPTVRYELNPRVRNA